VAEWNDVATACKTILDALSGFPDTTIRKEGVVYAREKESLTTPQCVIAFGDERPYEPVTTFGDATNKPTNGKIYGLVFQLYLTNPGNLDSTLTTNPNFVKQAKQALNTITLAGAASIWQTELVENPAWENQPFGDGAEVSEFGMNFYSAEARNG
jgi:hypothetical protein